MKLLDLFRRRRVYWHVQFEPDGLVYTYHRTRPELDQLMRERFEARGSWPHHVERAVNP